MLIKSSPRLINTRERVEFSGGRISRFYQPVHSELPRAFLTEMAKATPLRQIALHYHEFWRITGTQTGSDFHISRYANAIVLDSNRDHLRHLEGATVEVTVHNDGFSTVPWLIR